MTATVKVRMYNPGFGDLFLVTVARDERSWRLLIDCGVHSQGRARPLAETVDALISDLEAASPDGVARLDVIVATHHHADHIAGFASDEWQRVEVGEVWLPFVENDSDPAAIALSSRQQDSAQRLLKLMSSNSMLYQLRNRATMKAAADFALNSLRNADAADRLLGRNGAGFATQPRVRFLPSLEPAENTIALPIPGATVHVLGPSRDPAMIKWMDPPARVAWLRLDDDVDDYQESTKKPLFDSDYRVRDPRRLSPDLRRAQSGLRLTLDDEVLAASSVLERGVNNTSLFFVLDVSGVRFIFPGDAQHGAWEHVLADPAAVALLENATFYKVGHHGSHNATPKRFIEEIWRDGGVAMLPYGKVDRWAATIPKAELIAALAEHHHHLVRADEPQERPPDITVHGDLWTEFSLEVPEP